MKFTILMVLIFSLMSAQANTYYFSSSSGNDARTSKEAQNINTPWQSLNKLNSILGSLKAGDVILFKRGDTFSGSIVLAGTDKRKVRSLSFGAYGSGAKPIISGFREITAWTKSAEGIYENTLPDALGNLNMVVFQDSLQPMGRWPKADASNGGYLTLQSHEGTSSITSEALATAKNFTGGELVIRKLLWVLDRGRITNQTANTVSYTPFISPAHPGITYEPTDNYGFFFQNNVNALTQPGDWCYDSASRKLTMFFGTASPASFKVRAAIQENLVDITYAENISFDNMAFTGANANAIKLFSSTGINVSNCDISFSGINGIHANNTITATRNTSANANSYAGKNRDYTYTVSAYSNNVTVKNCTITNTNNNAINVNNSSSWTIENNVMLNTGRFRGMGMSGDAQYNAIQYVNSNSVVQYNRIINTGYLGIHFIGDNTVVKNNYVDNYCLVKSDGGGIYTQGVTGVNRNVTGNIVSNGVGDRNGINDKQQDNPYMGQVHGIYMDGESANVTIEGNTAFNNAHSGIWLGSSTNISVRNNLLYNNTVAQLKMIDNSGYLSNLTIKGNMLVARDSAQLGFSFVSTKLDELNNGVEINGHLYNAATIGSIDSNWYARPLYEPQGVDGTYGYPDGMIYNYPRGGIAEFDSRSDNSRFYSLDTWQTLVKWDANTKRSPFTIDNLNNLRFEFNPTNAPQSVSPDGSYADVKGQTYTGSLTLAPYSAIVLLKAGMSTVTRKASQTVVDHSSVQTSSLTVFPNPFRTMTTVQLLPAERGLASIDVLDQQGRMVKRLFSGTVEPGVSMRLLLDLAGLPDGVYFVRFASGTKVITKQVTLAK